MKILSGVLSVVCGFGFAFSSVRVWGLGEVSGTTATLIYVLAVILGILVAAGLGLQIVKIKLEEKKVKRVHLITYPITYAVFYFVTYAATVTYLI
ncbi:hypothetical protein MYX06_02435 [Patescibacteria group bacterium AH-259-L05]|nr:hypothetical protein [Patescibacteria group bacterium AH-259-L05]